MNKTILQIPINSQMHVKATKVAEKQGFSSLQEIVRVFLNQLIMNKIQVSFAPPALLSDKNDERYAKMIDEVKSGKVKTKKFSDINKMMTYLNK